MKNSQKITKIHLTVNDEDIPAVIGIVSADPDYRLSLKLNKKLSISLKNIDPVEFQDEKNDKLVFSRFSDSLQPADSNFQLVSTRSGKNFLLKKLRNIDFLLLLNNSVKDSEMIMSRLREIDSVTGVFNIEKKILKDKNLKFLI
jgi:tRNA-binding EMAP/Myf-like protein